MWMVGAAGRSSRLPLSIFCLQAENINALVKAAGVSVEPYWAPLFAKLAQKKSVDDFITNVGAGTCGGSWVRDVVTRGEPLLTYAAPAPSLQVVVLPPRPLAVPPLPLPRRPPRRRPRRRSLRRRTPTWASLCSTEHLLPVLPLCNASGFGMLWQVFGTEKGRVDKGRRAWYQGLFLWTNQAQR